MNPEWLQTGNRRATVGAAGATAQVAGRAPAGERLAPVDEIDVILATIRQLESGGRYDIGPNKATASGAYQYISSTWKGYGGYAAAHLAPPEVQDERARGDVEGILVRFAGDVSMVPVIWYYPRAAVDPLWMDRVPNPTGGNRLTIREYQARWLETYQTYRQAFAEFFEPSTDPGGVSLVSVGADGLGWQQLPQATPVVVPNEPPSELALTLAARSAIPVAPPSTDGERSLVFPVLGPVTYADGWGDCRDGCRRRHVGTDIIGVQMQPLLAAADGTITRLSLDSTGISGVAIAITDADGWRYNYFHVNNDTPATNDGLAVDAWEIAPGLRVGSPVRAGQIIGYMGNSGNAEASTTHLHFEIRDPSGLAHPSYAALQAAAGRQACSIGIGAWSTPTLADGADLRAMSTDALRLGETSGGELIDLATGLPVDGERALTVVAHTVVTPMYGNGQWIIDTDGRVTATGDAALIIPSRDLDCAPGPLEPFGTDAAGWVTEPDSGVLAGTALQDVDLTGTILAGVLPRVDDLAALFDPLAVELPAPTDSAPALPTIEVDAFRMPSTGEVMLLASPIPAPEQ